MHPQLQRIFDEAENRYLQTNELNNLGQYVGSLPKRLDTYRTLRNSELSILQEVATQLQAEMPQEPIEALERSIKNALVSLRYCTMGMLLDDATFLEERLLIWLRHTARPCGNPAIDTVLCRLLNQQLAQTLTATQIGLLKPMLTLAEAELTMPVTNSLAP
ncbi:MAG: hypothetical protein HC881_05310 [Leptolyngbyaceae cyanobacterium SL_7_1]|nr:hypothetical protein [Leptolyngbyaceae cyanobacterium SL_7_1]